MAAFTVQMTGTNEIPADVLVALRGTFAVARDLNIVDQLSIRQLASSPNQRLFEFGKILEIDSTQSADLLEYEDPPSVPLSGVRAEVIAKEQGRVVTTTALSDAISGGALGRQAAAAVGRDAARWMNINAVSVLAAGTNGMFVGEGTSAGLTTADVMTPQVMNLAYARLSLAGATKDADGLYRAFLTPGQIHDLKNADGPGSWSDINKYSNPSVVLRGQIGVLAGFRIFENTYLSTANQAGGPVDVNTAIFMGADALGQGLTVAPDLRITMRDKLERFVNYGWYAVIINAIIAQEQVYVVRTASSLGVNV